MGELTMDYGLCTGIGLKGKTQFSIKEFNDMILWKQDKEVQ